MISIILINPPSDAVLNDRLEPPLGLLYIAAVVREERPCTVRICDLSGSAQPSVDKSWLNAIPEADVYGITCLCTTDKYIHVICSHLREKCPDALIILGGPNASADPVSILIRHSADIIVAGEGEDAFTEVIGAYIKKRLHKKNIVQGKGRQDIDTFPFPARDLIDYSSYGRRLLGEPVVSLLSSRGCRYSCIHCNSIVMGGGTVPRYRSPDNITDEISGLLAGFRMFRFNDDHFTGHPELIELCRRMEPLNIRFRSFARIEDLTDENCRALSKAGCVHVSVGLESFNPQNLSMLGKSSQSGTLGNIMSPKKYGIAVRASFMIGLPYDTRDAIVHHFSRIADYSIDEYALYPIIPFPGTSIAIDPGKYGYTIVENDMNEYVQLGSRKLNRFPMRHVNFNEYEPLEWLELADRILTEGGAIRAGDSKIAC